MHRLVEPVGLLEGSEHGGHGAADVLAVVHAEDRVAGVAGGVGGEEDGLDRLVLDHLLERRIGLRAAAGLGQAGAAVRIEVADGDHLGIGMVLESEGGAERQTP